MYDKGKIITGIVIFLFLITFPAWYNALGGKANYEPKPKIVTKEKKCIEPKEYIRVKHSDLLEEWRESVVRKNVRTYVAQDGKRYDMSLVRTCMKCHSNKLDEFCNQCHTYLGIIKRTKRCWECHTHPKEIYPEGT